MCAQINVGRLRIQQSRRPNTIPMALPTCIPSRALPRTLTASLPLPDPYTNIPQILAIGMIFFPESPRYLIATDREEEGMRILRKLHYNGHNDAWIQAEFDEIRSTIAAEKAITVPGWTVMFTVPQWRKRLLLGTLVQVFTQFTGISKCLDLRGEGDWCTNGCRCYWLLSGYHVRSFGLYRWESNSCVRNLQLRRSHRK